MAQLLRVGRDVGQQGVVDEGQAAAVTHSQAVQTLHRGEGGGVDDNEGLEIREGEPLKPSSTCAHMTLQDKPQGVPRPRRPAPQRGLWFGLGNDMVILNQGGG